MMPAAPTLTSSDGDTGAFTLDRWLARNQAHGLAISEAARNANIIVDLAGTVSVAGWAYAHGASLHAATWLQGEEVEPLSGRWRISARGIRIGIGCLHAASEGSRAVLKSWIQNKFPERSGWKAGKTPTCGYLVRMSGARAS
jgi:hypothetical protein